MTAALKARTLSPEARVSEWDAIADLPFVPGDVFSDLQEGIRCAVSWTELEGWIDRACRAQACGALKIDQVEHLVEQAVGISQCLPD